jgi:flagellar hook protein FlgE
MRLESALFASKEGINAHGQAISVIGDNIANANTTGFKASRVEFADLLAEASGPSASLDSMRSGSGVAVKQVRQLHIDGIAEYTGRSLDAAIAGNGMFILTDGRNQFFSRAGNFGIGPDGTLINPQGYQVLGFGPGQAELEPINLFGFQAAATPTKQVTLNGNLDATRAANEPPADPDSFAQISQSAALVSNVQIYDSLGEAQNISLAFFKTDVNTWSARAYIDGSAVGGQAGVPVQIGAEAIFNFNNTGGLDEADFAAATIAANINFGNGAAQGEIEIDLSSFTQFAGGSQVSSIAQDGFGVGNATDFEIRSDGQIFAILDTGSRALVGTIPLATFTNLNGLQRSGNNLYTAGADSGEMTVGVPGVGTLGGLQGSALERSTVDIAAQFVDLVLYQRGYQASSQTLNAANMMLRDTLQLLR